MRNTIIWALVAFIAVPGIAVAGKNPKFSFGDGLLGFAATVGAGDVRCVGGEPTGGVPQCSEGTIRIFGRDEEQIWYTESVSPAPVAEMLEGPITFVVNCNFNAEYRGPCWGTFTWEVPGAGGTWEGQWTAPIMDLMTYESEISMVGFGVGGSLDGMQLKLDGYSNPGDWYITFTVRIKE